MTSAFNRAEPRGKKKTVACHEFRIIHFIAQIVSLGKKKQKVKVDFDS